MGLQITRFAIEIHCFAIALTAVGCCATTKPPTKESYAFLRVSDHSQERRGTDAHRAFDSTRGRYATTRSYRDRGVVTSTIWTGGQRSTKILRFDTLFVRNVGFRFRFFDELGRPQGVIWQHNGVVTTWLLGKVRTSSLQDSLVSQKGASNLASHVVPSLLFAAQEEQVFGEPVLVDIAPVGCGKCWIVMFGSLGSTTSQEPQLTITFDESLQVVRRAQSTNIVLNARDDDGSLVSFGSDSLIVYEPEFDPTLETLVRELELQPW